MYDTMGVISKGARCNVAGCENEGLRSLNSKKVVGTDLDIDTASKKAVLCKTHYKEWKKETKGERDLERARYDRF